MLLILGVFSILGLKSRKSNHPPKTLGGKAHLNIVFEFRKLSNCLSPSLEDLTRIDLIFSFLTSGSSAQNMGLFCISLLLQFSPF